MTASQPATEGRQAARSRHQLLLAGRILAVVAVLIFLVVHSLIRLTATTAGQLEAVHNVIGSTIELIEDPELHASAETLHVQAERVIAGGHPWRDPAPQAATDADTSNTTTSDEAQPTTRATANSQAEGDEEDGLDLAELGAEAALATATGTFAGELEQYANWLADQTEQDRKRYAEPAAAPEPGDGSDSANEAAEAPAEPSGPVVSEEQRQEILAKAAERLDQAKQLGIISQDLRDLSFPLTDPNAWQDEVLSRATLWGLSLAALPLLMAVSAWHLARRRRAIPGGFQREHIPSARARLWRQERDLQYNTFSAYCVHIGVLLFPLLLAFLLSRCAPEFGVPGGGGGVVGEEQPEQTTQVVEVVRRKLLVNPFSPISFSQPEEVEIDLKEVTHNPAGNAAQQGGEGEGSGGYEGGEGAKVHFVALNHGRSNWNEATGKNGGVAARNLLRQIATRIGAPVEREPAEITVSELRRQTDPDLQPPLLYVCLGRSGHRFSGDDARWLREYCADIGGMLLVDAVDGGAERHFRNLARQLFPEKPVLTIQRDDLIMRIREDLTQHSPRELALARHSGERILGVKYQGRWVMVFHPGDLVDGWRNAYGPEWQETAYQFGVNTFDYAMSQFTRKRTGRGARSSF